MRIKLPFLVLLACVSLTVAAQGQPSPSSQDIQLQGLRGERLGGAELAQGTTILVFWTSWSPHSRDIVARVNPLAENWGARARVITVSFMEERSAVDGFLSGKGFNVPVFLDPDGAFARKYAVATLPSLLIIRDGQAVYKGRLPDDPDRVIADYLH
jgi:thiol-disulfide isomerase/thioredoxin